jgi:hypothetical protein
VVFRFSEKMMRKQPHRSKRRLSPEFGKIDAETKSLSRFIRPPANADLLNTRSRRETRGTVER